MSEEKRLEQALLKFIERVTKEPATEKETEVLPAVAQVLVTMWSCGLVIRFQPEDTDGICISNPCANS